MTTDPVNSAKQPKPELKPEDIARRRRFLRWLDSTFKDRPSAIEASGKQDPSGKKKISGSRLSQLVGEDYPFNEDTAINAALTWGLPRETFLVDREDGHTFKMQSPREASLIAFVASIYRPLAAAQSSDVEDRFFEMLSDIASADEAARRKAITAAAGAVAVELERERKRAKKAAASAPSAARPRSQETAPKAAPRSKPRRTAAR